MRALRCAFATLVAVVAIFVIAPRRALASVWLKPGGESALRLRAKFIKAETLIERQFAVTELNLVFNNEASTRTEADFIYTLPPGAVVTSFAYWFGKEKVPARIALKETAASIYEFIRAANRDPALVEMVDQNTFRARIFPIEANADLRVEMRIAQVLPSDEEGAYFELPVGQDEKEAALLDAFHVNVKIKNDESIARVANNYDLPFSSDEGSRTLKISQLNYRPPGHLRVHLIRPPRAMQAQLLAHHSPLAGERDGFFALALAAAQSLNSPRVEISGVSTSHLLPAKLPDVKAHQALVLFGRYSGEGKAVVTLSGITDGKVWKESREVRFEAMRPADLHQDDLRRADSIAVKGWAAQCMAQLSANENNRRTVIDLSLRFGLPSKYTSWLAVPKEEFKRYQEAQERLRRQRLQTNFNALSEKLVQQIESGHPNGAMARELRRQLREISALGGWSAKTQINSLLENRMYHLATQLAELRAGDKPDKAAMAALQRRLGLLARERGANPQDYIRRAIADRASGDIYKVSEDLAEEVRSGRANSALARKLRRRLQALSKTDDSQARWRMWELLSRDVNGLADRYATEKYSARPNVARLATMRRQLDLMGRDAGISSRVAIEAAQGRWANERYGKLAPQLVAARHAEPPDKARVTALEREIGHIQRLTGASAQDALQRAEHWWAHYRRHELGKRIIEETNSAMPNETRIAAMRRELNKLADGKPDRWLEIYASNYVFSPAGTKERAALEAVRDEMKAEMEKEQPDAAKIRELKERYRQIWRRVGSDSYWYGDWLEESSADLVKLGPELKAANEQGDVAKVMELSERRTQLLQSLNYIAEARYGDPLISIEAPADTVQVIAVLPGGEIKKLVFDAESKTWQARFDIPMHAAEGEYFVSILIVFRDGTRQSFTLRYKVDLTPPTGKAGASFQSAQSRTLRLELETENDTDRVEAVLPWGDRVDLRVDAPSPVNSKVRFVTTVQVPSTHTGKTITVAFIITDKAHNRTKVTVITEK